MRDNIILSEMENFFMALADKTRLRLLNLMRHEEICVCFFTEVLGESQPKISRHLAYLRNAGIVEARREGKWMHYSIVNPKDENVRRVLDEVLIWLGEQEEMQKDRAKYETICCSPEALLQIARTPMNFISAQSNASYAGDYDSASSTTVAAPAHNELEEFLL